MKNWDKLLFLIGCFLISLTLFLFVLQHQKTYLEKLHISKLEESYQHSQYVPANEFRGNIDDPELYSLAGYHYIRGEDPATINFEHQPLSKYFFGLSILIFGNGAVFQLIVGVGLLIVVFLLTYSFFKSLFWSLFPSFLMSIDPLFREQLIKVYPDLFLTFNVVIFFGLFLCSLTRPKLRPVAMFWLGLVLLSKSWLFLPIILPTMVIFLWFTSRKLIRTYLLYLFWTLSAYALGYSVYFFYHNPIDWVNLHLLQIRLYKSYVPEYPKGEIWRIIFTANWRRWFGDFGLMKVETWTIFWPISVLGLLLLPIWLKIKVIKPEILLFALWTAMWLASISLKLVFPRYLLPALPFLYLLLVYSSLKVIFFVVKRK